MNPPQVYMCSTSWTLLPPHTIPLGRPSAPAPSIQYHALDLDWQLISYMKLYIFQCHSPKSSSFTFIKMLFSSSLLSAIRVVSSAYLRLLIFLPAILIPACASSSLAFHMIYSAEKLNKQEDNILHWCTSLSIWNQSVVPCPVLTVASWPACRFLKRQVRCSGFSHLFKNFPQFVVIHTVKGFGVVNTAEIDVFFWNSLAFSISQCCCLVIMPCPTFLLLPASSVHGISQTRTLEWVAISFSRDPGIFLTQGSNLHLLHWQADALPLNHQGSTLLLLLLLLFAMDSLVCN